MKVCSTVFLALLLVPGLLRAQTGTGTLKGQVTDPTGAVIRGATVIAKGPGSTSGTGTSDANGNYSIKGLAPGTYTVSATAAGFAAFLTDQVPVAAGVKTLDISMQIEVEKQEVQVESEAPTVDVSSENNATTTVLKGKDLDSLSDDPDELQDELQELAGPSAGPNGGQIYIDGFTGGQLPPKSSIREIRINSNPFSSEYDRLGYGRIEILTKPGTNQYHGQLFVNGNDEAFNSANPFIANIPPYYTAMFGGNLSGPLGKKASFFLNFERRGINNASVSNFTTNDVPFVTGPSTTCATATAVSTTCSLAIENPRTRYNVSGRIDYQVSTNNTLTARYQYVNNNELNDIAGQQFLTESQLYNSNYSEHTVQITDTQTLSTHAINETRFQFRHYDNGQQPQNFDPTINVISAFIAGGNSTGQVSDSQNNYELQNYTSIQHGSHFIRFGGRLRVTTDSSSANSNFNGTWTFPSLNAYTAGLPSQFSITTGTPLVQVNWADVGLYAEDEWRLRPNMSLTYGLRYETQNVIHDHSDVAPRIAYSWGVNTKNKVPRTLLRAGFGMFYDRFTENLFLNAERLNGTNQQQIIVNNPTFYPNIPSISSLPASTVLPTVYQIPPGLHSPYTVQAAASVEQQLGSNATLSVTYLNSRGFDQFISVNTNAPISYTPGVPGSDVRPNPNVGNVYQYVSEGVFKQNQLIANTNLRVGKRLTLGGFYTLSFANSDTNGASSFPSNSYDLLADYGRAAFDVRNRVLVFGSFSAPYGIRLSPMVSYNSGRPFNITIGQDVNGDSIFNDRPALASGSATTHGGPGIGPCPVTATACGTPWGVFNLLPAAGTAIAPYSLTGPGQFSFNMRLSKTFGFGESKGRGGAGGGQGDHGGGGGPRGGGLGPRGLGGGGGGFRGMFGDAQDNHRYNLTFAVFARNLFNNVNLAPPVSSLTSPYLGTSNAIAADFFGGSAANRRIDLSMTFSF